MLEALTGVPFQTALSDAFGKFERDLPEQMREYLNKLPSVVNALPVPGKPRSHAGQGPLRRAPGERLARTAAGPDAVLLALPRAGGRLHRVADAHHLHAGRALPARVGPRLRRGPDVRHAPDQRAVGAGGPLHAVTGVGRGARSRTRSARTTARPSTSCSGSSRRWRRCPRADLPPISERRAACPTARCGSRSTCATMPGSGASSCSSATASG